MALGAQGLGYGGDILLLHPVISESQHAAGQAQPQSAPVALPVQHLYEPYLPGALYMRGAAGAAVHSRYLHYAHVFRQLQLAAVFKGLQFLRVREGAGHRQVVPHRPVGQSFYLHKLLPAQLPVKVYGDKILSHVKAHVLAAEELMGKAGDHMFPGVILHTAEPLLGVKAALHSSPRLQ